MVTELVTAWSLNIASIYQVVVILNQTELSYNTDESSKISISFSVVGMRAEEMRGTRSDAQNWK